ncbi:hypothetical protein QVD17_05245 [Tagetes erecta]|uniref:J domain-containing protein n=1 Tax=Tagetes erecta TaxID=13708 RepID=A0AAD8PBB9_TARER|nr:hypothetical protein QVD17_05245 [Tagetes erecta]
MECNKDEAIRAKNIAESKMMNNDFEGGRKFALKAQKLFPELESILQMLAVCDVHCSAKRKINGAANDLYGILQVESSADAATIKKQYRKLALVLHPDKNKCPGAEAAFKLIGEANMVLSDAGKRSLHDYNCRASANPTILKPQNPQENQCGAQNKHSNGHQQSQSNSKVRPSFKTFCPFCRINYEYYRDVVDKRIKCTTCAKFFIAIDIDVYKPTQAPQSGHAGMQNANPWTNTCPPPQCTKWEEVGKREKVKVDSQRAEPSFSKTGDAKVGGSSRSKTVENGNIKPKGGKEGVASKAAGGNPRDTSNANGKNYECSKRSRKRSCVSNTEEEAVNSSPEKRSRLKKSSTDVKDKEKEQKEIPADAELKEDDKSDSELEDDSEPVYFDVPDLEFSNFDKDKEEHCFAVDQIWAVYDTIDTMPKFYAQIRKVYSPFFRLRITWLEADPDDHLERNWAKKGLPVACGKFKRGDSEETKDRLMFSHQMVFEKGSKRFSFVIYPKRGEIWALYKDWDITKWSSDPETHLKYKYEIVEILSDFDKDDGVLVAYMVKVEGFVSLFQKTSRAQLAKCQVPSSNLFRFSHRIPSVKLTGNERPGVPVGSYELDTASLPDNLDQFYFSNNVKVKPENVSAQMGASFPQSPEEKSRSNGNLNQSTVIENKSNIAISSEGNSPPCHDDDENISAAKFTESHQHSSPSDGKESNISIHKFDLDKQILMFEEGQIWALRRSNDINLRCYAQIKKIESCPLRLHVDLLEPCSDGDKPNACGIYKASTGGRQIFQEDSFLYLVKAEVNGRNRFNIFPREKEIWILDEKQNGKCNFADVDTGYCDIVEVIENTGDIIKVSFLTLVDGYKSVFKALDRVVEIPIDEAHRFFYQVRAVLLTDEQDGQLRGFWELDLAEFSALVPS